MNAKARTARQTIKTRRADARNNKRSHTLASHGRLAGLDEVTATGVGGALRTKAKTCGITGTAARLFRRDAGVKLWRNPVRNAKRYSREEFASIVHAYNPRAARFVSAKAVLVEYTAA